MDAQLGLSALVFREFIRRLLLITSLYSNGRPSPSSSEK